jgi:hypothetical protein
VCNKVETINHIFFECFFVQYVWCCIREALGLKGSQFLFRIFFLGGCLGGWGYQNVSAYLFLPEQLGLYGRIEMK